MFADRWGWSPLRVLLIFGLMVPAILFAGCKGDDGTNGTDGTDGQDGASTGTVTGVVTNTANNNAPVAGATVSFLPDIGTATTNSSGVYTMTAPIGAYAVFCEATNYVDGETAVSVLAARTSTINFALNPTSPVILEISGVPSDPAPASAFQLTVTVTPMDGSTVQDYSWSQTHSAQAVITNPNDQTCGILLGDTDAYRDALIEEISMQSMGQYPLQRFGVLPINPWAMEEGGLVTFQCAVETDSGTYYADVDVHAELAFASVASGITNVPINVPVMMQAPDQMDDYDWTIADAPSGSTADFNDDQLQFPTFTPVEPGTYEIEVWDQEADETRVITIKAGTYVGAIDSPAPTAYCVQCHEDEAEDWASSGHAEIFTTQINTGDHYSESCLPCHTVGYNPNADNNGIDDQSDWQDWLDLDMFHNKGYQPTNWDYMFDNFEDVASRANIQCENCHGPQTPGHTDGEARISLSSEVCGVCHGEPKRHARYQQWLLSGHANYELAEDEGGSGNCSRCHTSNGFVQWAEEYNFDPETSVKVEWNDDEILPQTCVTCHTPHHVGTSSGQGTDAPMRKMGDTGELVAGFDVIAAGKGAVCMMCHNSRRNFEAGLDVSDARAPHHSVQTDVLVGHSAYWVNEGEGPYVLGKHSLIADTCVTCHVELTPPPEELSYNLGGTNHLFTATQEICSSCHGVFDGENLQEKFRTGLDELGETIGDAIEWQINEIFNNTEGSSGVFIQGYDSPDSEDTYITTTIDDESTFEVIHFGSSHGRQAMDITVDGTTYYHVQLRTDSSSRTGHRIYPLGQDPAGYSDTLYTWNYQGMEIHNAAWNYLLLEFDGSEGIHNPTFMANALVAAEMRLMYILDPQMPN